VLRILKRELKKNTNRWTSYINRLQGVSEETTTGVHRLYQMEKAKTLLIPAINVNDCVTKSKFDNVYGCRHSLPDGIMRATDVMLAGKRVLIAGFGDVGKGCASAMKAAGCVVYVAEVDPICALQACMEGYRVVTLASVLGEMDIVITATGNKDIVTAVDMSKMKVRRQRSELHCMAHSLHATTQPAHHDCPANPFPLSLVCRTTPSWATSATLTMRST
jgi:adenosylhomocysteinase